jgi:hypothetical protein
MSVAVAVLQVGGLDRRGAQAVRASIDGRLAGADHPPVSVVLPLTATWNPPSPALIPDCSVTMVNLPEILASEKLAPPVLRGSCRVEPRFKRAFETSDFLFGLVDLQRGYDLFGILVQVASAGAAYLNTTPLV